MRNLYSSNTLAYFNLGQLEISAYTYLASYKSEDSSILFEIHITVVRFPVQLNHE